MNNKKNIPSTHTSTSHLLPLPCPSPLSCPLSSPLLTERAGSCEAGMCFHHHHHHHHLTSFLWEGEGRGGGGEGRGAGGLLFSFPFSLSPFSPSLPRTVSRAVAGNGIRGQRASLRVAEDGCTTIRSVPSVHSASDLHPSLLQGSLQASNLCALPVVKISGTTFPKVTLSQFCWLQQTRSTDSGEVLSQISCNRNRASPRRKRRRKRLSTTRPPKMRGLLRRNSRVRHRSEVAETTQR